MTVINSFGVRSSLQSLATLDAECSCRTERITTRYCTVDCVVGDKSGSRYSSVYHLFGES